MNRVGLITPNDVFERALSRALRTGGEIELRRWSHAVGDATDTVAQVTSSAVDVVCLGPGLDVAVALRLAETFDHTHPEVCVLMVAEPAEGLWERALRAGVRDVLRPETNSEELRGTVRRALETARRRRGQLPPASGPPGPESRIISLVSPKGGSGKTTVAVNLAVGLARHRPGRVAIVDLDLQFGDVAAALQLRPDRSIADVARSTEPVNATTLKVYLASHPSSLWALCAPDLPIEAEEVTDEDAALALELLASEFAFTIVDTGAGLDEATLAALDHSTDVILVCPMDVAGVRSLRKELDALERLGLTAARRHLVLNRSDSRVGLTPSDVEEVLGLPVEVAIPSSRAIPVSLNEGIPLVESSPRAPAARQLCLLVDLFAGDGSAASGASAQRGGPGTRRTSAFRRKREA